MLSLKRMSPLFSALLACGMLLASSPVQAKELIHPFDFKTFETQPLTVTQDYVNSKSPKTGTFSRKESINDVHRVGVVGFQVVFSEVVAEQIDGSTWKGITQGNFSDNRWELTVKNVTPEVRQQITEQLYEEFRSQLADAGFEVAPEAEVSGNAQYQTYVQETQAKGKDNEDVVSQTQRATKYGKNLVWAVVPAGMPLEKLDLSADIFAGAAPGFLDGFKMMGNPFAATSQIKARSRVYNSFTDFTPVTATYYLDFKKLKAIGGFLPGNPFGSSAKDSTFGLSASPGSHMRFYTKTGEKGDNFAANYQLNFILKKPVQNVEPVGIVRFEKENIGTQALALGANMAFRSMGMSGIKAPRKVRKYELMVEPALFSQQASNLLGTANRMMVLASATEAGVSASGTNAVQESEAQEPAKVEEAQSEALQVEAAEDESVTAE